MTVRRVERAAADDYDNALVPGVRASADARRLGDELAFAAGRLALLAAEPPGAYGEIASVPDAEEAFWLAFLTAYLSPPDGEDPWAGISAARVSWASGEAPRLDDAELGPRTAHEAGRGTATIEAYRAWVERSRSQAAAFAGEASWNPARRFDRLFERLAFPGFHRAARYELITILARTGRIDATAESLKLALSDDVGVAAKRVFGIGDALLLDRRARDLAEDASVPLEAVELALLNWGRDPSLGRAALGVPPRPRRAARASRLRSISGPGPRRAPRPSRSRSSRQSASPRRSRIPSPKRRPRPTEPHVFPAPSGKSVRGGG